MNLINELKESLLSIDQIRLAILFGSAANGKLKQESDIDLAINSGKPLKPSLKEDLIGIISSRIHRPVDIIDLMTVAVPTLVQILTTGKIIVKKDPELYERTYRKMLFDQADFMPYYNRILKERREKWINS